MTDTQKTPGQIAYEAHNDEQLNRMYPWDKSQKKHMWEAAAEAVRAQLLERVAKLEARLEIDHVWRPAPNNEGDMIREEVPPEERDNQIDGIDARDSTISLLEDRLKYQVEELRELRVEFERMEGRQLKRPT